METRVLGLGRFQIVLEDEMSEAIKRYAIDMSTGRKVWMECGAWVLHADYLQDIANREAASRERALEDACRAVCVGCRNGEPYEYGVHVLHSGVRTVDCLARSIRSLMQQPGGEA